MRSLLPLWSLSWSNAVVLKSRLHSRYLLLLDMPGSPHTSQTPLHLCPQGSKRPPVPRQCRGNLSHLSKINSHSLFHLKFFLRFFFLCGPFFEVFIEFVRTPLVFFNALAYWPQSMWDLSFPTRNRTHTPCPGRWNLNHWTIREVPQRKFLFSSRKPGQTKLFL